MTSATEPEKLNPGLYIAATPIGNLGDVTLRAKDVLARCDAIACEDTRVTGKLLKLLGISNRMIRYDDHASDADRQRLIAAMHHQAIALVSDAGMPLVSDPGFRLVREARAAGITVTALPGASALRYRGLTAWARGQSPQIGHWAPPGGTNYMSLHSLGQAIAAAKGLKFAGIQAYQGAMQHMDKYEDRKAKIDLVDPVTGWSLVSELALATDFVEASSHARTKRVGNLRYKHGKSSAIFKQTLIFLRCLAGL